MNKQLVKRLGAILICTVGVYIAPTFCTKIASVSVQMRLMLASSFLIFCTILLSSEWKESSGESNGRGAKKKSNFDWGMHYFRAFAILAIMACHYAAWHGYKVTNHVFFTTSTVFFLFISGYLCQFLDMKRRDSPLSYYRKKLTNVICPFIVCSLIFAVMKGVFKWDIHFVKFMLLGRVQGQYWYIPFVSFLFLASPLICRLRNSRLMILFGVSALFFLVFPNRPGEFTIQWPQIFYFYTYFTVFYIMGFVYCRFKEVLDIYLKRYWYLWLVGALMMYPIVWNPSCLHLHPAGSGLTICLQRTLTMLCFLVLLAKLKDKHIWILDQIAKFSFTLYFVHFALYIQCAWIRIGLLRYMSFLPTFVSEFLIYCIYVAIMLIVSMVLKTAFGKHSRMLIGA